MTPSPSAPPAPPSTNPWLPRREFIQGILLGAGYGLFLRGLVWLTDVAHPAHTIGLNLHNGSPAVMTVAFLAGAPVVMGFLTVRRAAASHAIPVWQWIVDPWLATLLMLGCTALFLWEGLICIVMAVPIALLCASLGGILAGLLSRRHRLSTTHTVSLALLPILLAPAEALRPAPTQTRTVRSEIRVHASAPVVWSNIKRVPAITPAELPTGFRETWAQRIGFPRPIEATLSYEGVGGVRDASFERGLRFFETITAWQPNQRLAFRIQADTAHIPPTTLDEHVTIGGPYFDVLDGEYRLEPLPGGDTLLHLTSHQRLSTDINGYAGLWTDAIMQSLQTSILEVVQQRCQTQQAAANLHPARSSN